MIVICLVVILVVMIGNIISKSQEKVVTVIFQDKEIEGTNVNPGECIFELNEQKYLLTISTKGYLQYVDMDSLLSEKLQFRFDHQVWYRIYGTYGNEARDPIQLSFKKIDKNSDSCAQKIATIKKI